MKSHKGKGNMKELAKMYHNKKSINKDITSCTKEKEQIRKLKKALEIRKRQLRGFLT